MLRRLLALCAVITLSCGPQNRPAPCDASNGRRVIDPPVLVTLVGQVVDVEMLLPPAVFCPGGNPVATEVITEVIDALNQPVAHTHTPPASSNTSGYSTRISFTPTTAGVHFLTARFETGLGNIQRQLQVTLERSGETPWLRTTLGPVCDEVLPLSEAVLCRRGTQLSLMRGGAVTSTETVSAVATAGPVGWVWTDSQLSRLVDVDGGVERIDSPLITNRGAVTVTTDRWIQGNGSEFVEVSFGDGGLAQRRWVVDAGLSPILAAGLGLGGDVVGWATTGKVCSGAPDASVRCVETDLQAISGEGDALWLRGAESGVVAIARFNPTGGDPLILFVPAQSSSLTDARLSRPVFSWNGRLVAVRSDDLSFEAWRSPGVVARQSVTEGFVVFQLQTGETVIYQRK